MVGLLAEHAQQGAQALGAEPRGYELIVRWDRAMCSFLGSPYCGHPPEILITTALTITPGLLQRGRARESAEIRLSELKAEQAAFRFNGAALVRARRFACPRADRGSRRPLAPGRTTRKRCVRNRLEHRRPSGQWDGGVKSLRYNYFTRGGTLAG